MLASFPINRIIDIERAPEEFRLLERVPFIVQAAGYHCPFVIQQAQDNEERFSVVFLSLVAAGKNALQDPIIELALVKATFSRTRQCLLSIDRTIDMYEDPKRPLDPELNAEYAHVDFRNACFDEHMLVNIFADHPLIIAHGARWKRPYFDRRFPVLSHEAWACSIADVDWSSLGFSSSSLEFVMQMMGYFFDDVRLCDRSLALCFFFHIYGSTLERVIEKSFTLSYHVEVKGNTFDSKEELKELGLSYDRVAKCYKVLNLPEEKVSPLLEALSTLPKINMRNVYVYSSGARERFRE